jgi:hypothetical protein
MLFKNDEIYKMTAEDHREMKKRFPKYPIRLVYPESRVRPKQEQAQQATGTNPILFHSLFMPLLRPKRERRVGGMLRIRLRVQNGRTIFQPHNLILRGSMILQNTDIELVYWLVKCCPFLEKGDNWNKKTPKCVIEDLVGAAERKQSEKKRWPQLRL